MRIALFGHAALALTFTLTAPRGAAHADPPTAVTVDTSGELEPQITMKDVLGKVDPKATYKVERTVAWSDGKGTYMAVFVSSRKTGRAKDAEHTSAGLFVTTLRFYNDRYNVEQDIKELVAPCELDLTANFIDGATGVTDVDGDGLGELTFMYTVGCGGDVSPSTLKLLMLEDKNKYALRGLGRVDPGNGVREGGTFKADFGKAPASLLEHAKKVWAAHVDQN
jgi:hypothetical protein